MANNCGACPFCIDGGLDWGEQCQFDGRYVNRIGHPVGGYIECEHQQEVEEYERAQDEYEKWQKQNEKTNKR